MSLQHTGLIVGEKNQAVLINPKTAYIIRASCPFGCEPAYWIEGTSWNVDPDLATIFRTEEAGQATLVAAKRLLVGCLSLPGSVFDVVPLAGLIGK